MMKFLALVALSLLPVAFAAPADDCPAAANCKACYQVMDGSDPACDFCAIAGTHLGKCIVAAGACPALFGGVTTAKILDSDAQCTTDPADPAICANCFKAPGFGFCEETTSTATPKTGGCMAKTDAATKCNKTGDAFYPEECGKTGGAGSALLPASMLTAVVAYTLLH